MKPNFLFDFQWFWVSHCLGCFSLLLRHSSVRHIKVVLYSVNVSTIHKCAFSPFGKNICQQSHEQKVCGIYASPQNACSPSTINSQVKKYEHRSRSCWLSGSQPWLNIRITWKHFKKYQCQGATSTDCSLTGLGLGAYFKSFLHYLNGQCSISSYSFLLPNFYKKLFLYQLRLVDTFGKAKLINQLIP